MRYHLALLMRKGHIAFNCHNHTAMDESLLSAEDESLVFPMRTKACSYVHVKGCAAGKKRTACPRKKI